MKKAQGIIDLIFKAIALAMSVAIIILGIQKEVDIDTRVTLLGIGLAAPGIAGLQKVKVEQSCGSSARRDPCGGSWVTGCPTVTATLGFFSCDEQSNLNE